MRANGSDPSTSPLSNATDITDDTVIPALANSDVTASASEKSAAPTVAGSANIQVPLPESRTSTALSLFGLKPMALANDVLSVYILALPGSLEFASPLYPFFDHS